MVNKVRVTVGANTVKVDNGRIVNNYTFESSYALKSLIDVYYIEKTQRLIVYGINSLEHGNNINMDKYIDYTEKIKQKLIDAVNKSVMTGKKYTIIIRSEE